jgi:hypothetical protein
MLKSLLSNTLTLSLLKISFPAKLQQTEEYFLREKVYKVLKSVRFVLGTTTSKTESRCKSYL